MTDVDGQQAVPVVLMPNETIYQAGSGQQLVITVPHGVSLETHDMQDVQDVVVVSAVDGELLTDSVTFEVVDVPFQNGAEIAAVEEITVEQQNRLEAMLAASTGNVEVFCEEKPSPKKLYSTKPRSGRPKHQWSEKVASRSHRSSTQYETMDSSNAGDDSYDEYMDRDDPGYDKMVRCVVKKRMFAHRLQWSNKNMESAMKDVQENNMTLRGAAKKNNVPYSTLKDRIQGRVVHGTKPGVKTVLSPEEESELVICIQQLEAGGFQLHCADIRELARQMLMIRVSRGFSTPYRNGCPGHNWYAGFLKRHPGIEIRRMLNKNVVLSANKQKHMLKQFFNVLSHTYKKSQLHHKPERIFTIAEMKLTAYPHATAVLAADARGMPLPPFVVLRGLTVDSGKPAVYYPPEFKDACFFNSRGRQHEDILLYWLRNHFLRCMPYQQGRPLMLLLARTVATDISLRLVQVAADESVSLVCLPNGICHLLQPLSASVLRSVDAAVSAQVEQLTANGQLQARSMLTPSQLAQVLKEVWFDRWPTSEVTEAYTESGIYPLNVRAITMERIAASAPDDLEAGSDNASVDDEEEDDYSTDDAEHGLNLLSELSTMEQMHDSETMATTADSISSFRLRPSVNIKEESPPSLVGSTVTTRSEAKRFKGESPTAGGYYDEHAFNTRKRRESSRVSEELMKRILSGEDEEIDEHDSYSGNVGRGKSSRHSPRILQNRLSNVQYEIAAARNNYEQINEAVESIVDNSPNRRRLGRPRTSTAGTLPVTNSADHDVHVTRSKTAAQQQQHTKFPTRKITSPSRPFSTSSASRDAENNSAVVRNVSNSTSTVSTGWPRKPLAADAAVSSESKDVIEEVDLSDLYVAVGDESVTNNNAKLAAAAASAEPVVANVTSVQCNMEQLPGGHLEAEQKVDVIQNIVLGGRTVQIIRRMPVSSMLKHASPTGFEDTAKSSTACELGDDYVQVE